MTCDLFLLICVFSSLLNVDSSADYTNVNPRYGTLEDWDRLLKGCHDRGMKLMMDLVVNHTSDEVRFPLSYDIAQTYDVFQHSWFKESRDGGKNKTDNPKRDWYIWRPPTYDSEGNRQPPNNWISIFTGASRSTKRITVVELMCILRRLGVGIRRAIE